MVEVPAVGICHLHATYGAGLREAFESRMAREELAEKELGDEGVPEIDSCARLCDVNFSLEAFAESKQQDI